MFDLIKLPEEFKVNRVISGAKFAQMGNLTSRERKLLESQLVQVVVQYSIKCESNQEVMILVAEINSWGDKYKYLDLARSIASSMPYKSLIVLQRGDFAAIVWQEQHENSRDEGRLVSDKMRTTDIFEYTKCKSGTPVFNLIESIACGVDIYKKADSICSWWGYSFSVYQDDRKKHRKEWLNQLRTSYFPAPIIVGTGTRIALLNCLTLSEEDAEDLSTMLDEYEDLFTETCCEYCYSLFCDLFDEEDFSEEIQIEWLLIYIPVCRDFAYEAFKYQFQPIQVYRIRQALEQKRKPTDDYPLFDIEDLRERLIEAIGDADDYFEIKDDDFDDENDEYDELTEPEPKEESPVYYYTMDDFLDF